MMPTCPKDRLFESLSQAARLLHLRTSPPRLRWQRKGSAPASAEPASLGFHRAGIWRVRRQWVSIKVRNPPPGSLESPASASLVGLVADRSDAGGRCVGPHWRVPHVLAQEYRASHYGDGARRLHCEKGG